jgi:arginyl-tRNA synthetase
MQIPSCTAKPSSVILSLIHERVFAHFSDLYKTSPAIIEISDPPRQELGDFAVPCFGFSRQLRRAPAQIANMIAERLGADGYVSSVTADGPYINIFFNREIISPLILQRIFTSAVDYGASSVGNGRKVVIDFSHPNIAKPFHVGHLRSTNLGAIISRILAFQGYDVFRKNYLGDWGTQFGYVIYGWEKYGSEERLKSEGIKHLVSLYIQANRDAEESESVKTAAREIFHRLEQGDTRLLAQWRQFRDLSIKSFQATYSRLGIEFDSYDGEAAIGSRVEEIVERFVRSGVAQMSNGALVVEVQDVLKRNCSMHAAKV